MILACARSNARHRTRARSPGRSVSAGLNSADANLQRTHDAIASLDARPSAPHPEFSTRPGGREPFTRMAVEERELVCIEGSRFAAFKTVFQAVPTRVLGKMDRTIWDYQARS